VGMYKQNRGRSQWLGTNFGSKSILNRPIHI
jgi:hypothetical protein